MTTRCTIYQIVSHKFRHKIRNTTAVPALLCNPEHIRNSHLRISGTNNLQGLVKGGESRIVSRRSTVVRIEHEGELPRTCYVVMRDLGCAT